MSKDSKSQFSEVKVLKARKPLFVQRGENFLRNLTPWLCRSFNLIFCCILDIKPLHWNEMLQQNSGINFTLPVISYYLCSLDLFFDRWNRSSSYFFKRGNTALHNNSCFCENEHGCHKHLNVIKVKMPKSLFNPTILSLVLCVMCIKS